MLKSDKNKLLTETGAGTPMGDYLRRYWHPVAGVSEFDDKAVRPIRLFGEDLVLYKDLSNNFALIQRHCPHRAADLSFGYVESCGIRCAYHGWQFDRSGQCTEQPYEETVDSRAALRKRTKAKAYPAREKAGLVWVYMGPLPAPELPDWEFLNYDNGFAQAAITEIPCNWFQCQENTMDPVHFEWTHNNWTVRQHDLPSGYVSTHLKVEFEEFEYGFIYRRLREGESDQHPQWTIGRVSLWPNGFYLGHHCQWVVPIDDEMTLVILWTFTRVPKEQEPYVQTHIPSWSGPLYDAKGEWITSHVANQDFAMWVGQGAIPDRSVETLGASDRGLVLMRRRFLEELNSVAAGNQAKALITDPEKNHRVFLPSVVREEMIHGLPRAEQEKHQLLGSFLLDNSMQYGQPLAIQHAFEAAMGKEMELGRYDLLNMPIEKKH